MTSGRHFIHGLLNDWPRFPEADRDNNAAMYFFPSPDTLKTWTTIHGNDHETPINPAIPAENLKSKTLQTDALDFSPGWYNATGQSVDFSISGPGTYVATPAIGEQRLRMWNFRTF
jgi:hypothetical protein